MTGKAINTYERMLLNSGWQRVTHVCQHTFISFISYSFSPFISRWQVVTLPESFVLLKKYIELFTLLYTAAVSPHGSETTDKREVFGSCLWNLPEDSDQRR